MFKKNLPKLDFNITNRCNFRCVHCCFKSGEQQMPEFSLAKIKRTLVEFKKLGGQRIDITGGEPTLRTDIKEIIKIGKWLGLKIELVTNGSLLSRSKLREFKALGLDAVAISLDGADWQTYGHVRGTDKKTFDRIIKNIKYCIKLGFYTKINTVVFKSNFANLSQITKLAVKLKAQEHGLYYFSPIGRGGSQHQETVNPLLWLKAARSKFKQFSNQIKISMEVPVLEKEVAQKLNTTCYLQDPGHLQILPDGNVYPCAILAAAQQPLANLHQKNLTSIWQDRKKWFENKYKNYVTCLFKKYGGCVDYAQWNKILKNKKYKFVCLCRKFSLEDLVLKNINK